MLMSYRMNECYPQVVPHGCRHSNGMSNVPFSFCYVHGLATGEEYIPLFQLALLQSLQSLSNHVEHLSLLKYTY